MTRLSSEGAWHTTGDSHIAHRARDVHEPECATARPMYSTVNRATKLVSKPNQTLPEIECEDGIVSRMVTVAECVGMNPYHATTKPALRDVSSKPTYLSLRFSSHVFHLSRLGIANCHPRLSNLFEISASVWRIGI